MYEEKYKNFFSLFNILSTEEGGHKKEYITEQQTLVL